jgi:hypothetical protein
MAFGFQEPSPVWEYRGRLQAVGSVAREAISRVHRGDAANDVSTAGRGKN